MLLVASSHIHPSMPTHMKHAKDLNRDSYLNKMTSYLVNT